MSEPPALPFDDSRRLTGGNLFFASTGAVLEVVGVDVDAALLEEWGTRVRRARAHLGWPTSSPANPVVARRHATGASLALAAPFDQLFTATEVNEWALCSALHARDPLRWSSLERDLHTVAVDSAAAPESVLPPVLAEAPALARLERLAAAEARQDLRALVGHADSRRLAHVLDEEVLTLGTGKGGSSWRLDALPRPGQVDWRSLHDVPAAAVTGSNGKTTTVRLLAACGRAHGWTVGYNCTDGVFVDGVALASGDYSGPVGTRTVLRDGGVDAAILETARGGILRRGLAIDRATAAIVTNVSSDHFGEYGIHDLEGLADVKLTVAQLVGRDGLLVLNADDDVLVARSRSLQQRLGGCPPLGWFALDAAHELIREHRSNAGATCAPEQGRLVLSHGGARHDLGAISDMPLSVDGSASYNIANLAAAALGAAALGIDAETIARTFARFGSDLADNPGRMMRFQAGGVQVLVDYAHNPEGLRGLLQVARGLVGEGGRLGMLLGHAGNRQDADLERVAAVAAGFRPDLVVVKENEMHLRGRAPGEIPRIIREALLRHGLPESSLPVRTSEVEAARCALEWARPGDVVALLIHSSKARSEVLRMLGDAHLARRR